MATKKAAAAVEDKKQETTSAPAPAPAESASIETSEADAVEDPTLAHAPIPPAEEVIYTDHNGIQVIAATDGDMLAHRYAIGNRDVGFQAFDFQRGPIKEVGINGVQNEHLLAVLIHRTTILNARFPCDENLLAIRHMKQAINALQARTANRQARGVEGENKL